jgi:DNA-directed RNA polymerase
MRPALAALNALQSVPFTINERVLGVIRECDARGIEVKGLPSTDTQPRPKRPDNWNDLPKTTKAEWYEEFNGVNKNNRKAASDRVLFADDMSTAGLMAEHDRFWMPMYFDWRGRVYSAASFNFLREDRVRALFLFADGEPIGEEGLYWLKVHVANRGDFEKISKRPFVERVQWADDNRERIKAVAVAPTSEQSIAWWRGADSPFMFLAACMELADAVRIGPGYSTHLPVSFDGSCNGLQHLCAMTRAKDEGALVNLTSKDLPQDIYQTVADKVNERIERDLDNEDKRHLAQAARRHGIDRTVVKRNVMTYPYSSKVFGMTQQLREDLMAPLSKNVRSGKLKEHPFGADKGFAASKYLAQHTFSAIEETITRPGRALVFLQKLARALAAENKALCWTSPAGIPWINSYHEKDTKRVKLWLHDRGVRVQYTPMLAVGHLTNIDADEAAQGVAPNFVHALDAAHLLRTVNAATTEGIRSIVTVHDSFSCLASRAGRFRKLIREEFVRMYQEHDVLTEVFKEAKADLNDPDNEWMPEAPPEKGTLDIAEMRDAEFAFA